MRYSKKSQYKVVEERVIYAIASPLSHEIFLAYCRKDMWKKVYQQHYHGHRYMTEKMCGELKQKNLRPCCFILEEITTTKVDAYSHLVVWVKLFLEAHFLVLNKGEILSYSDDLLEKNIPLYEERKTVALKALCSCENCMVSTYGRQKCLLRGEESEDEQ